MKSASGTPARERRDVALDAAKGLGIVLVVLWECLSGLERHHYFSQEVRWPGLASYVLYSFAVPLFFAVSGTLVSTKDLPAEVVVRHAVGRLAWPYLLWATVQWGVGWYVGGHARERLPELLRILWQPDSPYWFLYALFFCHLVYLLVRRWTPWAQVTVAAVLFVLPMVFEELLVKVSSGVMLHFARGFLFFVLGAVAVGTMRQVGRWAAVVGTTLFVALVVGYYQTQFTGISARILLVPVSITGIVAAMGWARWLVETRGAAAGMVRVAVAFFGRYSMSIYVMHIFFTAGVWAGLRQVAVHPVGVGLIGTSPTGWVTVMEIVAAVVAGVLGPLGVNWVASRVKVDRWLGLQRMGAK